MNLIKKMVILFFSAAMVLGGLVLVCAGLNALFPSANFGRVLDAVMAEANGQIAVTSLGAFVMLVGLAAPYKMGKNIRSSRMVAFQNPDGEVTVSLSAIEDYIQKVMKSVPGIKEIKSKVDIVKKGIDIVTAVSVSSGVNIPEITERIQLEVRNKIQSMLGVEGNISMKIHITKILKTPGYEEPPTEEEPRRAPNVPYLEG